MRFVSRAGVLSLALLLAAGPAAAYVKPSAAPLIDGFRPPDTPYGPGNRGHEYDTVAGEPIVASDDGTVVFAGPVGGVNFVVIAHGDGLRTTYGHLGHVAVAVGQSVEREQKIGSAGERLHFGVRRNDLYLDPASVLDENSAHLVPVK